jgi:hypothetical protein
MKPTYRKWLEQQKYDPATINAQMYRAERVEEHYGDLDQHYANDRMESLISTLRYTADDKRRGRPNPSKIPFEGDIKNNLASYRNSVERYRRFRDIDDDAGELAVTAGEPVPANEDLGQKVGLERDIQAALRTGIEQLEPGLVIIDDGAERSVESGFIDITARDASGAIVVIELKAGSGGQRAVAQILSYMGDVAAEDKVQVRGILVAADFDRKARAAARMVPNLLLRRYTVHFQFYEGGA